MKKSKKRVNKPKAGEINYKSYKSFMTGGGVIIDIVETNKGVRVSVDANGEDDNCGEDYGEVNITYGIPLNKRKDELL